MPRPRREIVPGGVYHITARGNNQQNIFVDNDDRQTYLQYLYENKQVNRFKLYLYVLMNNHVHLLLRTSMDEAKSISVIMKSLNTRYTKYYNRKYNRSGHLFQGRYHGKLIKENSHLIELTRYVHLNPLRASLVRELDEYPYSSYLSYVGRGKGSKLLDHSEILSLFGGKREKTQQRRYKKFVEEGVELWRVRVSKRDINAMRF